MKHKLYRLDATWDPFDPDGLLSGWYRTQDLAVAAAKSILSKNAHKLKRMESESAGVIMAKLSRLGFLTVDPRACGEIKREIKVQTEPACIEVQEDQRRVQRSALVAYRQVTNVRKIKTVEVEGQQYSRTEIETDATPWVEVTGWIETLGISVDPQDLRIIENIEEIDSAK